MRVHTKYGPGICCLTWVLHHAPHPSLICIMLAGSLGLAATTRFTCVCEKRFKTSANLNAAFASAWDKHDPATNKRLNRFLKVGSSIAAKMAAVSGRLLLIW